MTWSWLHFLVGLAVALVVAAIYHLYLRSKGQLYERVFDRVVEETSDESTRMESLAKQHAAALSQQEAASARQRSDHDTAVSLIRKQHETELGALRNEAAAAKAEAARVTVLVGQVESSNQTVSDLRAQILAQKDEYSRLEIDWKRRLTEAETAAAATAQPSTANRSNDAQSQTLAVASTVRSGEAHQVPEAVRSAEAHPNVETGRSSEVQPMSAPEGSDDLELIEGIGPVVAAALRSGGLDTFQRLAAADQTSIEAALRASDVSFAPSSATWARQAQFLADGDRSGFDAYAAALVAGRDSNG